MVSFIWLTYIIPWIKYLWCLVCQIFIVSCSRWFSIHDSFDNKSSHWYFTAVSARCAVKYRSVTPAFNCTSSTDSIVKFVTNRGGYSLMLDIAWRVILTYITTHFVYFGCLFMLVFVNIFNRQFVSIICTYINEWNNFLHIVHA